MAQVCVYGALREDIRNQAEFDAAMKAVNSGEEKSLFLHPGVYTLSQPIRASQPLCLKGSSATITLPGQVFSPVFAERTTLSHYVYHIDTPIPPYSLFVTDKDSIINVSESVLDSLEVNITPDDIIGDVVRKSGIDIKIPITDNLTHLSGKQFSRAFGYFDCGWAKIDFTLHHIDEDFLYCTTLDYSNVPSFNYDKVEYKKGIRYVIYNAELKDGAIFYDEENLYVPKSAGIIRCIPCCLFDENKQPSAVCLSDVCIDGIRFANFNGLAIRSGLDNLCEIRNCEFRNTLCTTLDISKKNNSEACMSLLENCSFYNCSLLDGFIVNLSSDYCVHPCITVTNCTLSRYPSDKVSYKNWRGAIGICADVIVNRNVIYNTCRDHVFITRGKSIVSDNIIYNTPAFNSCRERNLSNDWGGIYCGYFTPNAQTAIDNKLHTILLENNFIHDVYASAIGARGIYIDDGRGDVCCRYNLVVNTQSFSLDSRDASSYTAASSIRNVFEHNMLGTRYRLSAGASVPYDLCPILYDNVMFGDFCNVTNERTIKNKSDIIFPISILKIEPDRIYVSKTDFKKLCKLSYWSYFKRYVYMSR